MTVGKERSNRPRSEFAEWQSSFPRLYAICEASKTASPDNYFNRVVTELRQDLPREVLEKYEKALAELDPEAFEHLKAKCARAAHLRALDRGYQAFFDLLNEAWGYVYLKRSGCESIHFIPVKSGEPRPDLCGHTKEGVDLLEVKNLGMSADEIAYFAATRTDPRKVRAREATLRPEKEKGVPRTLITRLDSLINDNAGGQLSVESACDTVRTRTLFVLVNGDLRFLLDPTNHDRLVEHVRKEYAGREEQVVVETWPHVWQLLDSGERPSIPETG